MNKRPSEALKETAAELAQWINSGQQDPAVAEILLQKWTFDRCLPRAGENQNPAEPAPKETSIGIWKRCFTANGVVYERDVKNKRVWHQWANVHKIHPKGEKKRVILLGESVARGFFYDPYYTVAGELEAILNAIPRMPPVQVTDLARTNAGMQDLLELARSCRGLEPDAVVIFAGNNWHMDLYASFSKEDYREMQIIVESRSFFRLNDLFEKKIAGMIRSFFEKLEKLLPPDQVPCLFIIPGSNLMDWKNAHAGRSLPWLSDPDMSRWVGYKEDAEEALKKMDMIRFREAAAQMVTIDPSHPYGYVLLSKYHIFLEQWEEARENLEFCRDTGLVNRGDNNNPVCFGVIRNTLLAEAKQHGVETVDSQSLYDAHVGEAIPGRDFFLDYCHLTVEGIKIIMKETAKTLVRRITGKDIPVGEIKESGFEPDKEIMAIAHFSAAIHNAHRDQPPDIIEYHCRKAISCFSGVKEVMLPFVDFSTRHAPTALCKSFESVILSGKMQQYDGGFALQHPKGGKLMDISLVDAVSAALNAAGIPIDQKVARLRIQEHAISCETTNLLESFYSKASYNVFPGELGGPAFLQARSTESSFRFVVKNENSLYLELVYRTPDLDRPEDLISIVVNGRKGRTIRLPMCKQWKIAAIIIPPDLLSHGINQLTISWPYRRIDPDFVEKDIPAHVLLNALSPVLGEIHSFSVVERDESPVPEKGSIQNIHVF